jgi:hypothetical protein
VRVGAHNRADATASAMPRIAAPSRQPLPRRLKEKKNTVAEHGYQKGDGKDVMNVTTYFANMLNVHVPTAH